MPSANLVALSHAAGPDGLPAPALATSLSGGNIILSWPVDFTSYTLQSRTGVTTGNWNDVGGTPGISARNYQLTVPASGQQQFFRLIAPARHRSFGGEVIGGMRRRAKLHRSAVCFARLACVAFSQPSLLATLASPVPLQNWIGRDRPRFPQ